LWRASDANEAEAVARPFWEGRRRGSHWLEWDHEISKTFDIFETHRKGIELIRIFHEAILKLNTRSESTVEVEDSQV